MRVGAGSQLAVFKAIESTAIAGVIMPDAVVTAARDPGSVLHPLFPWDDKYAAHQHRLHIARGLIREIHYQSVEDPEPTVRQIYYVHDPRSPPRTQGYMRVSDARKDRGLSVEIAVIELDRIGWAVNRLSSVCEGLGIDVTVAVEAMEDAVADLRADLTRPPKRTRRRPTAGPSPAPPISP